jgi:hypothetical protein
MEKVYVAGVVGVPAISPVKGLIFNPGGKVPLETDQE